MFEPRPHRRHSIRIKGYDYRQPGYYFITTIVQDRKCCLGEVRDERMILNSYGKIVRNIWEQLADLRENVRLDEFIVMPNHFHGILVIVEVTDSVALTPSFTDSIIQKPSSVVDLSEGPARLKPDSLGSIIGQFKSVATKQIRKLGNPHFKWQRNYYEHIVRNEKDLNRIQAYIKQNPINWHVDRFY